mmetsp:Transcript_6613/g.17181  ORF Transcript_6613/g.17181 Transcript_6613/m.17181 type:complete len:241 (+) Transcript_6613:83-805(+)|eukprot:CAMPEP_0115853398 /NCGR_PEP_ID=MMETSP0287-20121206/13483_1 /TAXON_ID=412157 /ORGANISM="Chrysochromulina rotalis, Strain UIO044" /LENGTH=240 /DNA_ID=CAMNT_0003307473 /DNA_START=72 /DNA_END=794 /DNA_ORIENTATION=-
MATSVVAVARDHLRDDLAHLSDPGSSTTQLHDFSRLAHECRLCSLASKQHALCNACASTGAVSTPLEFTAIDKLIYPGSHEKPVVVLTPEPSTSSSYSSNSSESDGHEVMAAHADSVRAVPQLTDMCGLGLSPTGSTPGRAPSPAFDAAAGARDGAHSSQPSRCSAGATFDADAAASLDEHVCADASAVASAASAVHADGLLPGASAFPSSSQLLFGQPPKPFAGYRVVRRSLSSWRLLR